MTTLEKCPECDNKLRSYIDGISKEQTEYLACPECGFSDYFEEVNEQ